MKESTNKLKIDAPWLYSRYRRPLAIINRYGRPLVINMYATVHSLVIINRNARDSAPPGYH